MIISMRSVLIPRDGAANSVVAKVHTPEGQLYLPLWTPRASQSFVPLPPGKTKPTLIRRLHEPNGAA